jgi:TPR repeat protein
VLRKLIFPIRILLALLLLGWAFFYGPLSGDLSKAGKAYEAGNFETAFNLFSKVARRGEARAQNMLGIMYEDGKGVAKDDKQAVYWYTKAAESGKADAQFYLATKYLLGEGVAMDNKQAVYWLTKSAEGGYANAQYILGLMYDNGEG